MGTTIRRQPVNFDIPASPNYKFLNITNFRGLDVSSNPFELSPNTASDCLNVYVDETNTLTTRPRLEKKSDKFLLPAFKVVGVYSLSDGYLTHGVIPDGSLSSMLYVRNSDNLKIQVVPTTDVVLGALTIPTTKCMVFEKDTRVYFLDSTNGKYCYFDRATVDEENAMVYFYEVDGYVPTLATVAVDGVKKYSVEKLNLLTDKYVEKYAWDGIEQLSLPESVKVVNNTYKQRLFEELAQYEILQYCDDDTFIARKSGNLSDNWKLYYGVFSEKFSSVNISPVGITVPQAQLGHAAIAKTSKDIIVQTGTDETKFYKFSDGEWVETATFYVLVPGDSEYLNISANGKFAWCTNSVTKNEVMFINTQTNVSNTISRTQYQSLHLLVADNETVGVELGYSIGMDSWGGYSVYKCTFDDGYVKGAYISGAVTDFKGRITPDGKYYYTYSEYYSSDYPQYSGNKLYLFDLTTSAKKTLLYSDKFYMSSFRITDDIISMKSRESDGYYLYYATIDSPDKLYNTYFTAGTNEIYEIKHRRAILTLKSSQLVPYVWDPNGAIDATLVLSENSEEYSDWLAKRNALIRATLYTRFDNNYWFASGNRYYRSQYNDPTYFPITEYNDLGDSNEEITGFNLANDTTLIAYKKHGLYLIQPFTSSLDTTEYTITESKNTVGNTAIGAPIVTTLTEIPLQINNDGIYGLSQLSNVSATERIADLMSEPINERWLNIYDGLITNAQTLNRLYWTYVILPYAKYDKTMIYLLDNRSKSWYYWELPIVVLNAFVKDNHAEFVDVDGNIYYLTSTDIENTAFDTQLVTEYYDDGKKLIPWYWQSQILPLGTMNYSKRLVNTTFILTDTDDQDGYGLQYNYKVFRKLASNTPEKELSGDLTLVRSTTKKTNISKFGFIQLRVSNITEESQGTEAEKAYRNNKLRLVGLGLKYVLLEGLIR